MKIHSGPTPAGPRLAAGAVVPGISRHSPRKVHSKAFKTESAMSKPSLDEAAGDINHGTRTLRY